MVYVDMVIIKPVLAEFLRKVFGRWQGVRGVPRLLWWLRRLTFPSTPALVYTPDGLPIVINREDYGQLMLYYFPYCRELQAVLSDVIRPGDICLDLGANVGLLTAHMANCVGESGKVIAVEPNPPVAAQLKSMAEYFFPERVVVASVGISARDGRGVLYGPAGGFSESMEVTENSSDGEALELLSIDTLVQRYFHGRNPNFIKLDIEGNEAYLIESMKALFAYGCRPALLIEFHPEKCERRGVKVNQVIERLGENGYQVRRVQHINGNYLLRDVSHEYIGRDNLLFMLRNQLALHTSLAIKWFED